MTEDERVATVAAPWVVGASGLAVFPIDGGERGSTTVHFRVRDAAAALPVVVESP